MISPLSSLASASGAPAQAPANLPVKGATAERLEEARELKQTYAQFVGETFFGQMLKSMRETVSEPAYFHGGMAEDQFQSRLDQQIAQDLASNDSGGLADDLFASQFPEQAEMLEQERRDGLASLDALRRR